MGLAQPVFGGLALGHVQHHAIELALVRAAAHRRAAGQAAHGAVGLDDAQVQVEQALVALHQHVQAALHRSPVGVMHVAHQVVAERRRLGIWRQPVQAAHLGVPMHPGRIVQFHAPHAHAGCGGGHLQPLRQSQRLLLRVEAVTQVEHHAHMPQHAALCIAPAHAAGEQGAPLAIGAAAAQFQVTGAVIAGVQVDTGCAGGGRAAGLCVQLHLQRLPAAGVQPVHHQGQRQAVRLRRQAQQGPAQCAGAQQAGGGLMLPDGDVGQRQHQVQLGLRVARTLRQAEGLGVVEHDAVGMCRLPLGITHHLPQRADAVLVAVGVEHPVPVGIAARPGHRLLVQRHGLGAVVGVDGLQRRVQVQCAGLRRPAPEAPHLRVPVALAAAQVMRPGAEVGQLRTGVQAVQLAHGDAGGRRLRQRARHRARRLGVGQQGDDAPAILAAQAQAACQGLPLGCLAPPGQVVDIGAGLQQRGQGLAWAGGADHIAGQRAAIGAGPLPGEVGKGAVAADPAARRVTPGQRHRQQVEQGRVHRACRCWCGALCRRLGHAFARSGRRVDGSAAGRSPCRCPPRAMQRVPLPAQSLMARSPVRRSVALTQNAVPEAPKPRLPPLPPCPCHRH